MSVAFLLTTLVVVATPGTGAVYSIAAGLSRGSRAGDHRRVRLHCSGNPDARITVATQRHCRQIDLGLPPLDGLDPDAHRVDER